MSVTSPGHADPNPGGDQGRQTAEPDGHAQEHDGSPGDHSEHDHHDHARMFRDRFWVSLALTFPVVGYAEFVQDLFGYTAPAFPGSG